MNSRASVLTPDGPAVILSGLCLLHCLALPVMAAVAPAFAVWFEQEWVHRGLVLLAVPFTATALLQYRSTARPFVFGALAVTGLVLLLAAAFVESLHDWETPLTIVGAVTLSSAHIWRWLKWHRQ